MRAVQVATTLTLSRGLAGVFPRQRQHDPGAVLRGLAVSLVDGGDCLTDLAVLRHITVFDQGLAQLPESEAPRSLLVRGDSAGATHDFLDHVVAKGLVFSVGFDLTERVRKAVLAVPEQRC